MVYGKRDFTELTPEQARYNKRAKNPTLYPEHHTIAIAYKSNEWILIDHETIEFSELESWFPKLEEFYKRSKVAMLCLLQHKVSNKTIVLGNTHFEHNPIYDHVKFA